MAEQPNIIEEAQKQATEQAHYAQQSLMNNNQGGNVSNMGETILNNIINLVFSKVLNEIKTDDLFSLKSVLIVFGLYCVPEIKKIVTKLYNTIITYIFEGVLFVQLYELIKKGYYKVNYSIKTYTKKETKRELLFNTQNKKKELFNSTFSIQIPTNNTKIIAGLLKYIELNKETSTIDKLITRFEPTNLHEYSTLQHISNMNIQFNDIDINFYGNLKYRLFFNNNDTTVNNYQLKTLKLDEETIKDNKLTINLNEFKTKESLEKNLPKFLKTIVNKLNQESYTEIYNKIFDKFKSTKAVYTIYNNADVNFTDLGSTLYASNPSFYFCQNMFFDVKESISRLGYMLMILYYLNLKLDSNTGLILEKEYIFFDNINLRLNINYHNITDYELDLSTCSFVISEEDKTDYNKIRGTINNLIFDHYVNDMKEYDVNKLNFQLISKKHNVKEMNKIFSNFLKENVMKYYASLFKNEIDNKISIKNLYYKIIETETTTDNPKFKTYNTKYKELQTELNNIDDKECDVAKNIKLRLTELKLGKPEESIVSLKKTKELITEDLTKQYKSLDTLYLRENDKFILENMLKNFVNSDKIYEELGIRKKLGIMLHGVPGTGKSTTITTIGSYLKRDIYYVNIKGVETNQELQTIFDHVLKNGANKGIIVIEEIEKQTPIVYKNLNTLNNEINDTNNISDLKDIIDSFTKEETNKLDLSYLLNILDGTISQDGTVFIMTTNHIDLLEPALYRSGRMDICMKFKKADHHQIKIIFNKIFKRHLKQDVLHKIPEDKYTPADIIFHILPYIYNCNAEDDVILKKFMEE